MSRPVVRPIWSPQDSIDTAHQFHMELHNAERGGDAECPHDSYSGDEGPIAALGRWPLRWRCDGCGHIRYDNAERGHRYCVRCDKSQLVVHVDSDGVCRNCKRRSRVERFLFSRSRFRRARIMDGLAVSLLMILMAAFGCIAVMLSPQAKADVTDPQVIAFTAAFGGVVCSVLDDGHATPAGVYGISQGIVEESGLSYYQAGQVIGLSVAEICPHHTGLMCLVAATSGAWT